MRTSPARKLGHGLVWRASIHKSWLPWTPRGVLACTCACMHVLLQTRTEYRFAVVPGWFKIEIVDMVTRMGGVWQEEVRG